MKCLFTMVEYNCHAVIYCMKEGQELLTEEEITYLYQLQDEISWRMQRRLFRGSEEEKRTRKKFCLYKGKVKK